MHQKQHGAIANFRQARPKPAQLAFFVFRFDGGFVLLPFLAKRRIGQAVVETLTGKLVIGQRAALTNVLRQISARVGLQTADQHTGHTNRMGFRLQLLPVRHQHWRDLVAVTVVAHMVHGIGEEATRATGRVIQSTNQTGAGLKQGIIRVKQQCGRQVNDVTRRHEVLGPFIDLGTKAANQVFVDVTHHPIRHHVRVQVDLGKVLANLVQQARFLQPDHRIAKLKLLEDSAGVIRKQGDVVFQIAARLGTTQGAKGVFRGVVEGVFSG